MAHRSTVALALLAAAGLAAPAAQQAAAATNLPLTILQYFESEWDDMERRVPDVFMAGYNAIWTPPPSKASDPFSAGFDVFDRFDLGQPPLNDASSSRKRTAFGTEATFKGMVDEMNKAGIEVHIDTVLNHNSGRTTSDAFFEAGGWPGMWVPRTPNGSGGFQDKGPTDNWGDFHNGVASGFLQSENPGAPRYDLWEGDLVALCDIDQASTNFFIRQPTEAGNPDNIPAGTFRNQPDPANVRFYPDRDATPFTFTNPASNHSGSDTVTRYPFTSDPAAGDPITENATAYLARWVQWMLEVQGVDGFRLDASKHTFPWFWDTFFDSAVYLGRILPDGQRVTPFSWGENTTSNGDILANYYRKDSFANRGSLDLDGAGAIRNLIGAGGFGTWADPLSRHLDTADDGFQNGSAGVFHAFSHDNGTRGDGGSRPSLPTYREQGWFTHAYLLMRPGRTIVYHNARGTTRTFGFFPREGLPVAMGWDSSTQTPNDAITRLVKLRNTYGIGQFFQLNSNISDVLVFQRASGNAGNRSANVLIAANDRYDAGFNSVTVTTDFPAGQRLVELTGNAANPDVDPANAVPEIITVGAGGVVNLVVPRNSSTSGEHNRGYVVYGPFVPGGNLTIEDNTGAEITDVIPPDPSNFPDFRQRLTEIPVVTSPTFNIRLDTFSQDAIDNVADDNALFRINDGFGDWNGSGGPDFYPTQTVIGGFEQFTDLNAPAMSNPGRIGAYSQTINTDQLDEGFNYITTIAFRQRPAGTTPIYNEWRKVIYVDREPASYTIPQGGTSTDNPRPLFQAIADDNTTTNIFFFLNLPAGTDPVPLIDTNNRGIRYDAREWRFTFPTDLNPGLNTVTTVAIEENGRASVKNSIILLDTAPDCPADLAPPTGVLNIDDVLAFLDGFAASDPIADLAAPAGVFDIDDVLAFLDSFAAGCP